MLKTNVNKNSCLYHGWKTPIFLEEEAGFITQVAFCLGDKTTKTHYNSVPQTGVLRDLSEQLTAYFSGKLKNFDVPLNPAGTPFMQLVWLQLQKIPYGKTASYKDVAIALGKPGAPRAVGMANNRNPIAIVIPCHRVIGADGSLVGYGGGLDIKAILLKLEGVL